MTETEQLARIVNARREMLIAKIAEARRRHNKVSHLTKRLKEATNLELILCTKARGAR